jgi:Ca2+-binding RTX toxin-like protein
VAEVDPDVGPTADINHAVFDVGSVGALTPIGPIQTSNANIVSAQLSSEIVAFETGGYAMVWKSYDSDNSNPFSGYDIVFREFDANGEPTGPEQMLISGDDKYDHEPAISGLPNGNIVVSWHNSNSNYTDNGVSEIVMEVYDTTGHQVARHSILMTDSNRTVARNVDIAVDPTTGGYMLVFEYFDYDQPNYNLDIFAQENNANGQPLTWPFKLHPADNVDQSFAAATYLGDSTFVAAWRSKVNQGPGIFAMQGTILKPDGSVVNFTFSDKIEYGSAELEIVPTADGGFMTVWNGLGDFNTEMFGQRFDANGNPQSQVVPISVIDPDQNLRGILSNDVIEGGSGNDTIKGLKGNDRLNGHDGDDLIIGGCGWDRITGGEGVDTIEGRQGRDMIDGDAGDDHIKGGRGNDYLHGSKGNDTIFGGRGNDLMTGGADNDRLYGGRGHDKIYGGTGEDVINGGKGRDILFGGADSDTFIFQKGNRVDIVKDLNIVEDQIAVS